MRFTSDTLTVISPGPITAQRRFVDGQTRWVGHAIHVHGAGARHDSIARKISHYQGTMSAAAWAQHIARIRNGYESVLGDNLQGVSLCILHAQLGRNWHVQASAHIRWRGHCR